MKRLRVLDGRLSGCRRARARIASYMVNGACCAFVSGVDAIDDRRSISIWSVGIGIGIEVQQSRRNTTLGDDCLGEPGHLLSRGDKCIGEALIFGCEELDLGLQGL